ncbi:glutamine--fructose-6-phosphate transaminase (isomerizing) [Candidatus Binatus soli]|jgi:glucosamine--fructose-6-phosphate aminotransferase (isomerizing)|uniref:glutamine--fructose-6-phosphate transaminase (isomerizing) n=1 Tax=Candidatus Binatus soli TaxID=1953413 RepID=UPI003D0E2686
MCGIIGYVGPREAYPILLEGLGRLEYRGYDSAGIATLVDNKLEIRRAKGKLENLRHLLARSPLHGHIGIGHTRWATHGRPSEENAHPHKAGPVAVIHNGIVENFIELRAELLARGHKLRSQTDTELISHLIEEKLKGGRGLTEAVREAVLRLRGSFSIVVLSETEPDKLVAAKTATPLVLGLGDGENFIASDIPAILEHTRRVIVLEDGELAEVTATTARLMKFDGTVVTRRPRQVEWDAVAATKGGFRHYLRKEINDQPQAWIDTMAGRADGGSTTVRFEGELIPAGGPASIGRIVMLGAGASWITAQVGKFMIEDLAAIPVEVDYSSEFRYRRPPIDDRTMIIAVSQSGETADTIAAMEEGRARGAHLLAITNTVDSSIARKADAQLYTRCGPETSVTTTKCFLTQLEAYYLFAIHLAARMGRLSGADAGKLLQPAFAIPGQIEAIFEGEPNIQQIARKYAPARDFLFLGRGINYPIALEGALKLKEISYIHAEGYSAGEMKHGPIALIDEKMPVVVIIPNDDLFEKSMSNLKEVESRNGRIIAVTNRATDELKSVAAEIIEVPETNRMLTPVLMTVPIQLLAYHIAVERGTDVDQPRNLAKSVTVE